MKLCTLKSIQGGLGVWLDLQTGREIVAPVSNGTASISALDGNIDVMRDDSRCYLPDFEPDEENEGDENNA